MKKLIIKLATLRNMRKLKLAYRKTWALDLKWFTIQCLHKKSVSRLTDFNSKNDLNVHSAGIYNQMRYGLVAAFLLIVVGIDFTLGYGALQNIVHSVGSEDNMRFLCFCGAFMITGAELILGVVKSRFYGIDHIIPSIPWYKSTQEIKKVIFTIFAFCSTLLIPALSLSEYFDSVSVADMLYQLGHISAEGYVQEVKGLQIRAGGLSFLSIVTHSSLVLYTPKFGASYSNIVYKIIEYRYQKQIQKLEGDELIIKEKVITSLLQYQQELTNHISLFGTKHLPNLHFSDRVKYLHSIINPEHE